MDVTVHLIDRATLDLDAATIATNGEITPDEILTGDLGTFETGRFDVNGTLIGGCDVRDYGFKRNGIGEATIRIHTLEPLAVSDLRFGTNDLLQRELWIFDGDVCVWMGVPGPWAVDLDDQTVTVRCREVTQLLNGKVFGRADRENFLDNPGAEDSTTLIAPWTSSGAGTVTVDTTFANEGDNSFKIVAGDNSSTLSQTFSASTDYGGGIVVAVAGWFQIDGAATVDENTVLLELIGTVAAPGSPYIQRALYDPSSMSLDSLIRVEVQQLIGPGATWSFEVNARSVDGTINWDSFQASVPDSTTMSLGDDIGVLVGNVVEYSQTASLGQSDDLIGHDVTTLGIVPSGARGFSHSDHENIWRDGLMQIAEEFQVDIWLGMDRLIHADTHRGTLRGDLAVTVEIVDGEVAVSPSTVVGVQVDGDPSQEYSSVIVIGEGSSFAREEVGRVDTTAFAGLVKTLVQRAPNSATVRSMGDQADALLAQSKQPAALPSITYAGVTPPEPGDTVAVSVDFGCVFFDATLRVEAVKIDPKTGAVTCSFDVDWAA
jgi:hypothetical protein